LWWRDARYSPGGTEQNIDATLNNPANFPATGSNVYIRSPSGQEIYWSRGNGWVIAALVRVLELLPDTDPHHAAYVADFQAMSAALLPLQRSDGFWNENLDDPTHCEALGITGQDGPETSGTALFVYGFAWGILNGYLDEGVYGPAVIAAYNALSEQALQADGLLGYVQSTGNRPCQTEPNDPGLGPTLVPDFDDFGLGCFLLGGAEVAKLAAR
jgi:rhamnogalacturonyl hydrolase YesR